MKRGGRVVRRWLHGKKEKKAKTEEWEEGMENGGGDGRQRKRRDVPRLPVDGGRRMGMRR